MVPASKQAIMIAQVAVTNAATASGTVDTRGFTFASIDIIMTTSNNASNNSTVFNLLESDDTEVTNFATVSGFVGDSDWTIPNASTSVAQGFKFDVNLLGRKQYLRVDISPLTTVTHTAIANLHRASEMPINTTKAGVVALVQG